MLLTFSVLQTLLGHGWPRVGDQYFSTPSFFKLGARLVLILTWNGICYPVLCLYAIVQRINMFEYFLASIQVAGLPFSSLPLWDEEATSRLPGHEFYNSGA